MMHWTSLPAISERRIPIIFIRLMARHRFCTIRGASVGLGAARRNARVHRCGLHHRTRREDCSSLRLPRLAARIIGEAEQDLLDYRASALVQRAGPIEVLVAVRRRKDQHYAPIGPSTSAAETGRRSAARTSRPLLKSGS